MSCSAPPQFSTDSGAGPAVSAPVNRPSAPVSKGLDPAVASVPISVTIPGSTAPIDPVTTISDGELQLPETGKRIAWWVGGAAPGEKKGVTLLAGHVRTENEATGVFTQLARLRPGDDVTVTTYDGRAHRYVVTEKPRDYAKKGLPSRLFDPEEKPTLALVTCTGPWDPVAKAYPSNLIVWAAPAR